MSSKINQYQCESYVDDNLDVQNCECGKCGYEHNLRRWKEAYEDILKVCNKYADTFAGKYASEFWDIRRMATEAKDHLMLIEWYEKYGLKIDHSYKPYSCNYFKVNDHITFSRFGDAAKDKAEGSGRYISWPDDDRQPKNEWLLNIGFSTGAYIFGQDYDGQQQLFQDFFNELKGYNPDYSDSHNSSLYWKLENAKPIYEAFNGMIRKYRERNQSELKQREAEDLREKLQRLETELTAPTGNKE